jgi:hypothetical protein
MIDIYVSSILPPGDYIQYTIKARKTAIRNSKSSSQHLDEELVTTTEKAMGGSSKPLAEPLRVDWFEAWTPKIRRGFGILFPTSFSGSRGWHEILKQMSNSSLPPWHRHDVRRLGLFASQAPCLSHHREIMCQEPWKAQQSSLAYHLWFYRPILPNTKCPPTDPTFE